MIVPDSDSLDLTDALTIEGWVRPNVLSGPLRSLAAKQGDDGLGLGLFAAGPGGPPSGHATTDDERYARGTSKIAPAPTWTHLATTYDGTRSGSTSTAAWWPRRCRRDRSSPARAR